MAAELTRVIQVFSVFLLCMLYSDLLFLVVVSLICILEIVKRGKIREVAPLLKLSMFIVAFILLFNLAIPSGDTGILKIGIWSLNMEPLLFSAAMSFRLVGTVFAFGMLAVTTDPDDLTRMLSRIGPRVGAVLSLSTRYFENLRKEAGLTEEAMNARGLETKKGNWISRIRARIPILLPLIYSSLERGIRTAESMDSRGFGNLRRRTRIPIEFHVSDIFLIALTATSVLLALIGFILFSAGSRDYYSESLLLDYSAVQLILLILVAVPLGVSIGAWSSDRNR